MTLHCAITYFDYNKNSSGILIGADSRAGVIHYNKLLEIIQVDKSFRGEKTIGFLRGHVPVDEGENIPINFSKRMRGLEKVFDGIQEGLKYSNIPLLNDSKKCILLIGKQANDFIELYNLSNCSGNKKVARKLYTLSKNRSHDKTLIWYAPSSVDYFEISFPQMNFEKAIDSLKEFLIPSQKFKETFKIKDSYEPGEPNIYKIDFKGIERIV